MISTTKASVALITILAVAAAACGDDDPLGPTPPARDPDAAIQTELLSYTLERRVGGGWQAEIGYTLRNTTDGPASLPYCSSLPMMLDRLDEDGEWRPALGGFWPDCLYIPIPRLEPGETFEGSRTLVVTENGSHNDFAAGTDPPGLYRLRFVGEAFASCTEDSCDRSTELPDSIFMSNVFVLR